MKKDENEIEDIFKDSFENFEAEVSPSVWNNVQTAVKGAGLGLLLKTLMNKIGTNAMIAIVSSAAAVISTVVVLNWGGAKQETGNTIPKPVIIPKTNVVIPTKEEKPVVVVNNKPSNEATINNNKGNLIENSNNNSINKKALNAVVRDLSNPSIAFIESSTVGGAVPLIVNLSNTGTGKINKWNFGDGTKENGVNPVHVYAVPGVYTIALTSTGVDGKTAIDSVKIEVTGNSSMPAIPSDFSPNGDGIKDNFSFHPENMVSMSVVICDKNSNIVYKSESLDAKWDGTDLKGKPAKEGIYYYVLSAVGVDGKKYKKQETINLTR